MATILLPPTPKHLPAYSLTSGPRNPRCFEQLKGMFWKPWKLEERLQEHREGARVVNGGTLCQWDLIAKAVPRWKKG